jgi:DNA modification methylase
MIERHRFHSICPYFAMFPESFVRRNVLAWSKRDDVILDPFSGRGTTVFESLLNGRKGVGCDTNPVAFCLSKAKADPPTLDEVMERLTVLERGSNHCKTKAPEISDEFFILCFHETTLRQLLFLKKKLDWREKRADCFIGALALGCLHGESHRTDLCFSNRMPRTISTKPAYSVRWWTEKGCFPPERDVFAILRKCAEYRYESPVPQIKGRVVEGDARRASTLLRSYKEKVKLVITSPPYLDITDYHEDQWLRLWFLGGAAKPIGGQGKDDRHRRIEAYWQFLREAWKGVAPLLQESAQIVIRIGGTRLGEEQLRVGLMDSLNSTGHKFKLAEARQTVIKNGQRRMFQTAPNTKASVEHDFRFELA